MNALTKRIANDYPCSIAGLCNVATEQRITSWLTRFDGKLEQVGDVADIIETDESGEEWHHRVTYEHFVEALIERAVTVYLADVPDCIEADAVLQIAALGEVVYG